MSATTFTKNVFKFYYKNKDDIPGNNNQLLEIGQQVLSEDFFYAFVSIALLVTFLVTMYYIICAVLYLLKISMYLLSLVPWFDLTLFVLSWTVIIVIVHWDEVFKK
jgi:hypothetical protein|tara:strand:- start:268 stop:585 length:318 start_codon:yes stop_codon:yes gene_type:complete